MQERTSNPQMPGIAARAGALAAANYDRGARHADPVRLTFRVLGFTQPGPQRPRRFGYDLAMNLRRSSTAGPPAYTARLAATNRRGEG